MSNAEKTNDGVDAAIYEYLSRPLIDFDGSPWTIGNAVEGTQIFGGIGSGKTTGSGRFLALKYLSAGFGGLVLTVKPDEKDMWVNYCRLTGRSDDLIVVEPDGEWYFNFLEYESGGEGGDTANLVQVLKTVLRASEEKSSDTGKDPFWETALDMLIFHVIDLCKLAEGRVTVEKMYDIVQSLPKQEWKKGMKPENPKEGSLEQGSAFWKALAEADKKVNAQITEWKDKQSIDERDQFSRDGNYYNTALRNALPDARLLFLVKQFFFQNYLTLAEKTRSIIDYSFSGFLFRLLREPVYSIFCRHTSNFTPEDCIKGKIIVLNLPVKLYHKVGQDIQVMFKYIWQRAMEKRRVADQIRAVFLWADESQNFLHEYDASYQATARSSMIATVYLSQNVPNYLANMGGSRAEFRVKSFLGTLATKFFHANADIETNKYASELIGHGFFEEISTSTGMSKEFSASRSRHLKIDWVVRPEEIPGLKTGGVRNERWVWAFVHFQGNVLKDGESFIKARFHQAYLTHH